MLIGQSAQVRGVLISYVAQHHKITAIFSVFEEQETSKRFWQGSFVEQSVRHCGTEFYHSTLMELFGVGAINVHCRPPPLSLATQILPHQIEYSLNSTSVISWSMSIANERVLSDTLAITHLLQRSPADHKTAAYLLT